ncbi:MAG: hypothetical protein Q4F84_00175 [Fibrobacter sp.]|nr:hypothetical protein [Fibrobacter sp.]
MSKKILFTFLSVFVVPVSLFAARPFVTDDAGTVEQGTFELETSSDYWKNTASFGIGLKHGLTNRMDLGVAFGYDAVPKASAAAQPLEVSFKYNFIPEHFSASFTSAFSSSTYSINAIYSHDIKFLSLHANVGLEATEGAKDVSGTYSLAAVFNIGIVAAGLEFGGVNKDINWWQIGTQAAFTDWFALDIGVGGDFDNKMTATTGLWFGFPLSK